MICLSSGIHPRVDTRGPLRTVDSTIEKGITAKLFKGTDKIAVEIDRENKFSFISGASFEAGVARSDEDWVIVKNDKEYLIAVLEKLDNQPRESYNIFMLNKENGMAIWTVSRSTSFGTDTPEAQSFLLNCT